ncbi:ClC family H(+)/Cl(-) exchange transporter [Fructobacillus cardui]|uniref:RCK domain (TrkA) n=1 Tax=Fructobacillus cardui TaxID=2893170 RepID=A0ABN9YQG1_9LACO|nr:RCK domain (TrkA) [Fructobacillus cardui]CAK1253093.1 RCK domain (TrkA) [Fructobacillus cardui]
MQKNTFHFNTNRLMVIINGALVGVLTGIVVSVFRMSIEHSLSWWRDMYTHIKSGHWLMLVLVVLINLVIGLIVAMLVKKEPNIAGSGIPQVEGQLMDQLHLNYFSILWRKFVAGILAIGSGLMLGREGPSIQLGAAVGQGVAETIKVDHSQKKSLIAAGAASGLAAAFNAPLAGVMFVLEEIYHSFSPVIWLGALAGSVIADAISTIVFGQTPVLAVGQLPLIPVHLYGLLLILGLILGLLGFLYQKTLLASQKIYQWTHLPKYLNGLVPLMLVIPLGLVWSNGLGGGNNLVLALGHHVPGIKILLAMVLVRFIFSMISYGSGLPGGIFLPILTLGALNGAIIGQVFVILGWLSASYLIDFVVIGMAAYFAAIGKAPFTAIILIIEMVGSVTHVLPLAVVSLVAYLVVDLCNGAPIYESLLNRLLQNQEEDGGQQLITLEVPVLAGTVLDDREIRNIDWLSQSLITMVKRGNQSLLPAGDLILRPGDTIYVRTAQAESKKIRASLLLKM